ncbi:MAG: NAD(P)/FAD-dependent oxidoreductase [Candidatus Paceibacteria bacterium]
MVTLSTKDQYNTIIIGGGPAGLIAAITAAREGAKVLLLEKNNQLGKKLRSTGGGRCNITNNTENVRTLLSRYGEAGKFLFSPFAQFGVKETRQWFLDIGVETVVETEARVFPVSQSAEAVTEALIVEAKAVGVIIKTKSIVTAIKPQKEGFVVQLGAKYRYAAGMVIVATGGLSRPETGSTGDALLWLQNLGHTIETPKVALVPVAVKETNITKRLSGVALANAGISLRQAGIVFEKAKGKVLFTHVGLSGPGILNLSQRIGQGLETGSVEILLDLTPSMAIDVLEETLLRRFITSPNKHVQNQWFDIIPGALVVPLLEQAAVDPHTPSHSVTVAMRRKLIAAAKNFLLTAAHLLGSDKAIVTSGGVALTEIDFKTMESRLVPGLYIVGDVLNINRPSGGYSLQLAWTTGYVAGMQAAHHARVQEGRNHYRQK